MAVELVPETFADRVGERFEVIAAGGEERFEVVLLTCEPVGRASPEELREEFGRLPFSLTFHSPRRDGFWPQQIFTLRHEELGEFTLFMVPLGPDEDGMQYEAVIS